LLCPPQASLYFRNLGDKRTFIQVVDEIYYKVTKALTPWEKNSHSKNARNQGLCSSVRGVGTEGRPTPAFILLVKLFTLRPTTAQLQAMIEHRDSVYIRGIGLLFIRYVLCADEALKILVVSCSPNLSRTELTPYSNKSVVCDLL
jgi:hypothetical protein